MHGIDPYEPTDSTFECPSCGARSDARGECENCSITLRNISVAREYAGSTRQLGVVSRE